ncbi:MAG: PP2C family protein-serine/threonine phosphatase, partial [Thermoflexales bacterium]|nr:PP2C family protein-serine/threonine phosphatase [Thermoflexales bacterium]
ADEGAEPAAAPELIAALLPFAVTRALPLLARGRPVGALLLGVRRADRQRGERARTVLSGIAQQVAMAIDNAQLIREALVAQRLENELALARDIQQSFLPREAPQLEGWTIAVDWQSARQVGGDFYDFIHMQEDGRLGIAIADVADKGVPAALFMAMTRSLLRGAAFSGREPDAVLKRVNRLVLADTRSDLFVTVFYAILDAASGLMHYANAGHNPPLRLSATGELAPLAGNGMAIGVFEQVEIPLCTVKLDPGDVLLMYTDGLIDAVSESGEEFGLARLGEVLVACGARPASDIAAAAMDAIRAHTGGEQPFDDQTLVVIRRDPAGSANR